ETEPPYVVDAPMPRSCTRLTSFDTPDEYRPTVALAASPGFSVVTSGGIASASTQQTPTSATAAREAPTTEARDVSREHTHSASRRRPGQPQGPRRVRRGGLHRHHERIPQPGHHRPADDQERQPP